MPNPGETITIGARRFVLGEIIGFGGFGVVHAGREQDQTGRKTGPDLAIKLVDRIKMAEHRKTRIDGTRSAHKHFIEGLENEIAMLRTLQTLHEDPHKINVVRLIHAGTMQFDDEPERRYPALVMERCRMSLAHILGNGPGPCQEAHRRLLTQEGILAFLSDMANAVAGIAASGGTGRQMAHRDIKPANILEIDGLYLLTDFGNAKEFEDLTYSVGGLTENYVAPELWRAIRHLEDGCNHRERISLLRVDIYSLGMTAVKLMTGGIPWRQTDRQLSHMPDLLDDYRGKLRETIAALPLSADLDQGGTVVPGQRPTESAMAEFRAGLEQLVLDMVRIDPSARPDGETLRRRIDTIRNRRLQPSRQKDATPSSAPEAVIESVITPPLIPMPPPLNLRIFGMRSGALLLAGLAVIGVISASAFAMVRPHAEIAIVPVAPLTEAIPARWSGRSQDYVRPLCSGPSGPSLARGENIVANVSISQSWPGALPKVTAALLTEGGPSTPGHCAAMDAAGRTWQCVGATTALAGPARMVISAADGSAPVVISFQAATPDKRCANDQWR